MAAFNLLPHEILSLIFSFLAGPKDVLHLSLASRSLCVFAKLYGWKALIKGRFGLVGLDADALTSARGITTLYSNWDRKAFVARYLEPTIHTTSLNSWERKRWRGSHGQTIGYQPSVDSYEDILGRWAKRREVLAWSAGTNIIMRIKTTEPGFLGDSQQEFMFDDEVDGTHKLDSFGHLNSWYTYKIPNSLEGRDDITDLKLLRPHQKTMDLEDIVFGTASGHLSMLSTSDSRQTIEQRFQTGHRAIGSIDLSTPCSPMLAATLGDISIALYPVVLQADVDKLTEPLSEVAPIIPGARHGRIWSCKFLSDEKLAVGLGPSYEPIQVFGIRPEGFSLEPLRTFSLESKFGQGDRDAAFSQRNTSVYPILPIPNDAYRGSGSGNTFLSGAYDGMIRLHDMRSPRGFETIFWDPTNDSSIYSLATQGLERVVAGVSMHSMIKVFDLRVSGSNTYHAINPPLRKLQSPISHDSVSNSQVNEAKGKASTVSGGWNLYLNPKTPPKSNAYREDYWRGRDDSPVYSLSIPSSTSPYVYTGLAGAVQCLTFHSITDAHPDTMLSQNVSHFADSGAVDIRSSYNPQGDVLNLGMYEQQDGEVLGMQLLVQDNVSAGVVRNQERKDAARARNLDERWRDLREESERWARGQSVAQGPRRGQWRGRGGRGRGRGRGRGG